jgi:catabolite regulation protein CreA
MLDIVAVLHSAGQSDLEVGDVGTVVELLPPDGLEVEFLDRDGRTRCIATLTTGAVLVLNRERTRVA